MSSTHFPASHITSSRSIWLRDTSRTRAVGRDAVLIGAIIAVAALIRILTIDNQSLWSDEALTAYESHLGFGAMLGTVIHVETTPPLYFVAIWCWAKLFGTGEVALRSLSSLGGVALVPLAYVTGREIASRGAGLLAAAFIAVNPLMVWYSQEARSYMLLAVLTAAGFLWFSRAQRDPSRRNIAWWAVFSALALMTHFFAGFIVAPEVMWLLWRWRSRAAGLAVVFVVLVQLAMLPFAFADTSHGTGWIAAIPRLHRVANLVLEWGVGTLYRRASTLEGLIAGALMLLILAGLFLLGHDRRLRERVKLPALIAAFVFIVPLVLGLTGQDYFLSRNEIPAFLPAAVVVGAACLMPRRRVIGLTAAVALLGLFSVATARVQMSTYLQRPPWREVAHALGPARVQRVVLVADSTTGDPLKIYMPGVSWVENHARPIQVGEVDVVGVRKKTPLAVHGHRVLALPGQRIKVPLGWPVPRGRGRNGARLLERFRVNNWVLARFLFPASRRLSLAQVQATAAHYFVHVPADMLVFSQRPAR